jgi:hypothetical protein
MTMLYEASLVDRIERAHIERPHCECGRETVTTYRDGTLWLECVALSEAVDGRIHRLWNAIASPAHVRTVIAEVTAPEVRAA